MITLRAVVVVLVVEVPLLAHHSLANHETTKAVRVKGTVVQVHAINPHSFIYVEERGEDGQIRRGLWKGHRSGYSPDAGWTNW